MSTLAGTTSSCRKNVRHHAGPRNHARTSSRMHCVRFPMALNYALFGARRIRRTKQKPGDAMEDDHSVDFTTPRYHSARFPLQSIKVQLKPHRARTGKVTLRRTRGCTRMPKGTQFARPLFVCGEEPIHNSCLLPRTPGTEQHGGSRRRARWHERKRYICPCCTCCLPRAQAHLTLTDVPSAP